MGRQKPVAARWLPACRRSVSVSRIVAVDDQRFRTTSSLLQIHRLLVAQRGPKTLFSKVPGAMADVAGPTTRCDTRPVTSISGIDSSGGIDSSRTPVLRQPAPDG
jgi:hypothetical protein